MSVPRPAMFVEMVTVPALARALHDLRFLHVIFRVQHVVRNFFALQHAAEQLGRFHAHRADEDRLRFGVALAGFR